jgi:hypothetical protein
MFYLDYLLYTIILFQLLFLSYKSMYQEGFQNKKKKMNNKKADSRPTFQHTGKAFIPSTSIKPSQPSRINVMLILSTIYSFLSIFAMTFVQYPNQYIVKMRELLVQQLTLLYDFYKKLMQKSNEMVQTYAKKFNILGSIKVIFTKPKLNFYKGK